MKIEIFSAANFLTHLLRLADCTTESKLKKFRNMLVKILHQRYKNDWYPQTPMRGSGFRCIRITDKMDPIVTQAGEMVGLNKKFLELYLLSPLTIWIDPLSVSFQLPGSSGIVDLFTYGPGVNSPWIPPFKRKPHLRYKPEETTTEKLERIEKQTKKFISMSTLAGLISGLI